MHASTHARTTVPACLRAGNNWTWGQSNLNTWMLAGYVIAKSHASFEFGTLRGKWRKTLQIQSFMRKNNAYAVFLENQKKSVHLLCYGTTDQSSTVEGA